MAELRRDLRLRRGSLYRLRSRAPCLLAIALANAAVGAELEREEAFRRAALFDGLAYVQARSIFERMGRDIVPFLEEKAKGSDWRERNLARVLLLRIERPRDVAVWRTVLLGGWNLSPATGAFSQNRYRRRARNG